MRESQWWNEFSRVCCLVLDVWLEHFLAVGTHFCFNVYFTLNCLLHKTHNAIFAGKFLSSEVEPDTKPRLLRHVLLSTTLNNFQHNLCVFRRCNESLNNVRVPLNTPFSIAQRASRIQTWCSLRTSETFEKCDSQYFAPGVWKQSADRCYLFISRFIVYAFTASDNIT